MTTHDQDLATALEIIEQACREQPFCEACGQETRPVAHGGMVWLECPTRAHHKSRLARIISFQAGHTRRALLHQSTDACLSVAS